MAKAFISSVSSGTGGLARFLITTVSIAAGQSVTITDCAEASYNTTATVANVGGAPSSNDCWIELTGVSYVADDEGWATYTADLEITSPYKTGTLASIGTGINGANTRLNTSGVTWDSGDVGRAIEFKSGDAKGEYRIIVAQGTNYCDIDFAFGTFPILDSDGADTFSSVPAASDTLVVSYYFDDLDDGTNIVKDNEDTYRGAAGKQIYVGAGVSIYDTKKILDFDFAYIANKGGLHLGGITNNGAYYEGCTLVFRNDDGAIPIVSFNGTGNACDTTYLFESFTIFGANLLISGQGSSYRSLWRQYDLDFGDSGAGISQIGGCNIFGDILIWIGYNNKSFISDVHVSANDIASYGAGILPIGAIGLAKYSLDSPLGRGLLWNQTFYVIGESVVEFDFKGDEIGDAYVYCNFAEIGTQRDLTLRGADWTQDELLEASGIPSLKTNKTTLDANILARQFDFTTYVGVAD